MLRHFGQLRGELAIHQLLFQQVALDLAAGGLGDALHRHHLRHFEAGLFVDQPRDGGGQWRELRRVTPMQHEHGELVGLGARRTHAGHHHLAQFHAGRLDGDVLQVMRVVVLAVDEDDLLGAAGDVQLAIDHAGRGRRCAASHRR